MANQNGGKYGFTALFPIKAGEHASQLRKHLRTLDSNLNGSPLSEAPIIHMARFAIIDRLAYQGLPAKADTLNCAYLLFLCEFDGDSPEALVRQLIDRLPGEATAIWEHCRSFPGTQSADELSSYFEKCQLETTLFLADRPDDTVDAILRALRCKREFADLVLWFQCTTPTPAALKNRVRDLIATLDTALPPHPGSL